MGWRCDNIAYKKQQILSCSHHGSVFKKSNCLSSQNNNSLTINTFKDAFENRNKPVGLCFHSDQGYNYISNEYRNLLHSLKVKQSFSKKANPYDNAVIESFFSNFKREEINSHEFEFYEELEECVGSYIQYYNDYRPHTNLKNKTPNQVEQDYSLNNKA